MNVNCDSGSSPAARIGCHKGENNDYEVDETHQSSRRPGLIG